MKNRTPNRMLLVFLLVALVCTASGCKPKTIGSSRLTATVAGREIIAVIDGPGFIHPEADRADVSTSSNKITLERERVLLDGSELAKLPAAATKVEVTVDAGQLTVTADGAPITTKRLGK